MRREWAVLAVLLVAACTPGGAKKNASGENLLAPQFAPDTTVASAAPAGGGPTTSSTATSGSASGRPAAQVTAPAVPGATTAAIVDPQGDLTPSPDDPPPPWADLVGGTLIRRGSGFELRVRLGGGTAPATTDRSHTMNIASFYDVDGDGTTDYQVWANVAAGGWGGSWRDERRDMSRFMEQSGVTIEVAGDEVVVRFPLSHVGGAERFRWSLASEWGRYTVLGTRSTAKDDAPDDNASARFPG